MAGNNILSTSIIAGGIALTLYSAYTYRTYQRHLQLVGNMPGLRTLFSIVRPIDGFLPHWKFRWMDQEWILSVNRRWFLKHGHQELVFKKYGQDIISAVSFWEHKYGQLTQPQISVDNFPPVLMIADADCTQEIMGNRVLFPKPTKSYTILNIYGRNVVTTEGEDWRTHRKITAPTFSESNNKLVCKVTTEVMEGLFAIWDEQEIVEISNATDITVPLALKVISGAGFGMHVTWADADTPSGHQMSFKEAIEVASSGLVYRVLLPNFAMGLSKKTTMVRLAFNELERYMNEMIQERTQRNEDYNDLFSNLIAANERDEEGLKLSPQEMVGNIFIFLVAGHETTAHALAFALGLLALYQDVQEKLYNDIKGKFPDPSVPFVYRDVNLLTYTTAIFYETLRLFPMTPVLPKSCAKDTVLKTQNTKGEAVTVPVTKGSYININITAIHRNPRYWEDPDAFKPERFMGDWPRHAFLGFATGARACMGRRFAEVEAIIALSMIVRRYKIETKDAFPGETFEQKCSRVLSIHVFLTPTPNSIPITLTRRD